MPLLRLSFWANTYVPVRLYCSTFLLLKSFNSTLTHRSYSITLTHLRNPFFFPFSILLCYSLSLPREIEKKDSLGEFTLSLPKWDLLKYALEPCRVGHAHRFPDTFWNTLLSLSWAWEFTLSKAEGKGYQQGSNNTTTLTLYRQQTKLITKSGG